MVMPLQRDISRLEMLVNPVQVVLIDEGDGKYKACLIDGNTRMTALAQLGIEWIPAQIHRGLISIEPATWIQSFRALPFLAKLPLQLVPPENFISILDESRAAGIAIRTATGWIAMVLTPPSKDLAVIHDYSNQLWQRCAAHGDMERFVDTDRAHFEAWNQMMDPDSVGLFFPAKLRRADLHEILLREVRVCPGATRFLVNNGKTYDLNFPLEKLRLGFDEARAELHQHLKNRVPELRWPLDAAEPRWHLVEMGAI